MDGYYLTRHVTINGVNADQWVSQRNAIIVSVREKRSISEMCYQVQTDVETVDNDQAEAANQTMAETLLSDPDNANCWKPNKE